MARFEKNIVPGAPMTEKIHALFECWRWRERLLFNRWGKGRESVDECRWTNVGERMSVDERRWTNVVLLVFCGCLG